MSAAHPLDRPAWSALATGWAALAQGDKSARRLDPRYGPFAAAADESEESLAALAALVPPEGEIWLTEARPIPPVPGTEVTRIATLAQMVADTILPGGREVDFVPLADEDAPEMGALAARTKPGPFASLTHRLGGFIGVKREGRLVAMAGERMRLDRFTEVSGVCTDPDHRGRGYAGALMRIVASRMLARGETPFLHSYADNEAAIALYESLGFRTRATLNMAVLVRSQGSSRLASP